MREDWFVRWSKNDTTVHAGNDFVCTKSKIFKTVDRADAYALRLSRYLRFLVLQERDTDA